MGNAVQTGSASTGCSPVGGTHDASSVSADAARVGWLLVLIMYL